MKEEFELVENSTTEQLKKIIHNINTKNKGKTVYFKDFMKKIGKNSNNIINTEIVQKAIKVKIKNEKG